MSKLLLLLLLAAAACHDAPSAPPDCPKVLTLCQPDTTHHA